MLAVGRIPNSIYDALEKFPRKSLPKTVYLPLDKGRRMLTLLQTAILARGLDFISRNESRKTLKQELGQDLISVVSQTIELENRIFNYTENNNDITEVVTKDVITVLQSNSEQEIYEQYRKALRDGVDKCSEELGLNLVSPTFDITSGEKVLKQNKDVRCHDFAFYQIYEEQALGNILSKKDAWNNSEIRSDTENFLKKWGYERVDHPRKGDLVCYFDTSGRTKVRMDFRHIGIFTGEDDQVISKFGNGAVFRHDINQVLGEYGDCAQFYRKVRSFGIETSILNEIARLEGISVCSTKHAKKHIKDFIVKAAAAKKGKIPQECTLAVRNLERHVEGWIAAISELHPKDYTKMELLTKIRAVIKSSTPIKEINETKEN